MDVPGQDRPALLREPFRHEGLGIVTEPLGGGAVSGESAGLAVHLGIVPAAAYLAAYSVLIAGSRGLGAEAPGTGSSCCGRRVLALLLPVLIDRLGE